MKKHDLCKELQTEIKNRAGKTVSLVDISTFIDSFCAVVADSLSKGDEIPLPGFGKFYVSTRAPHEGINPSTGEKTMYGEIKSAKFKAGKALKEIVNS